MSDYLSRLAQRSLSVPPSRSGDSDRDSGAWLRPRPTSLFEALPAGDQKGIRGTRSASGEERSESGSRSREGRGAEQGFGEFLPGGLAHGGGLREGSLGPPARNPWTGEGRSGTGRGGRTGWSGGPSAGRGEAFGARVGLAGERGADPGSPFPPSRPGTDVGTGVSHAAPEGAMDAGAADGRGHGPRTRGADPVGSLLPSGPLLLDAPGSGPLRSGGEAPPAPSDRGHQLLDAPAGEGDTRPRNGRGGPRHAGVHPGDPERPGTSFRTPPGAREGGALLPQPLHDPRIWAALREAARRAGGTRGSGPHPGPAPGDAGEGGTPTIQVTIGRVEVRAAAPPSGSAGAPAGQVARDAGSSIVGLEEYLRLRSGGGTP